MKEENGEIMSIIEIWRDVTEEISTRWEERLKEVKEDIKKMIEEDSMI